MPQICTVCRHEKREEIDQALLAGEPLRTLAARTGTSSTALHRHRRSHIAAEMVHAKHVADELHAETLWDRLKTVNRETAAILAEARESRNHVIALAAISRVEKQVELEARLLGELSESARIAVGINVSAPPQPPPYDLSLLTDQELEQLEVILTRANALTRAAAR
jgi:hypothetical protein